MSALGKGFTRHHYRVFALKKTPYGSESPLHRHCIVLTRPAHLSRSLAEPLQAAGASILYFPTLAIAPIIPAPSASHILTNIERYDGILLTSQNAVEYFFKQVPRSLCNQWQQTKVHPRLLCVGQATARALDTYGLSASHVATQATAENLLQELLQEGVQGKYFLFPSSIEARQHLPRGLRKNGATVEVWPLYRPVCANTDPQPLIKKLNRREVDLIVVASPSTVRFLFMLIEPNLLKAPEIQWAAIGPTTAQSLLEQGISSPLIAKPPGIPGLVKTLLDHFT